MDCLILVGLQGSGKSTFFKTHFADTHVHVSMDNFPNARDRAARQRRELDAAFSAGRSVVVDNTNPTVLVRASIIQQARAYGARVIGFLVESSTRDAVARNAGREARARVPNVAIFATARKLEQPMLAEGFERLFLVRAQKDQQFVVSEWDGDLTRVREHAFVRRGVTHRYRVIVPRGYDDAEAAMTAWPGIVFLHGRGECGDDGARQTTVGLGPSLVRHPDRWPCVVLFPQKPDPDKAWEDYRKLVDAIVEQFRAEYRLDSDRMLLTGISQGGHGAFEFGAAHPDRWAALAPVCGFGPPERYAKALAKAQMPIWCFHGEADTIVPIARSEAIVEALKQAGAHVTFTRYPGVKHDSWEPAYADPRLAEWLLQQRLSSRVGAQRPSRIDARRTT